MKRVAYAAERATPEQIDALKAQVGVLAEYIETQGKTDKFYKMELGLYTEVARLSGNPLFETIASTH